VSPGYDSGISSLDDLRHSGLKYGSDRGIDAFLRQFGYVELDRLYLHPFDCSDLEKCMERVFTERDTTIMAATFLPQHVVTRIGKTSDENLLCSLDVNIFSLNFAKFLHRGRPVLERFNVIIRHCFEAELGEKYWSEIHFNLTLQNKRKSEESGCQTCSDIYFVFTLTHLRVVFVVLRIGHVLSVAVFVAELICKWLSKRRKMTVKQARNITVSFLSLDKLSVTLPQIRES
jgi:hypothetical protein